MKEIIPGMSMKVVGSLTLRIATYAALATLKTSTTLITWAVDTTLEWVTGGEWQ
jgi:hypothetical protein